MDQYVVVTCAPLVLRRVAGAAHGKGRGREVIAVAKSSDLVIMVLDAAKEEGNNHRCVPYHSLTAPIPPHWLL